MGVPFNASRAGAVNEGLILLLLGIVALGLLAGVVTLQWREKSFYAAAPSAWPTPGAVGAPAPAPGTGAVPVLPPSATP